MLVPTLLHTHRHAMRNTKGNVSFSLTNSFQLALQLVPRGKYIYIYIFELCQHFSLQMLVSPCN